MGFSILSNVAVKELASAVVRENIVQDILVLPGKSCDFRYVSDLNAKSIDIQRTKMYTDGRVIGAAKNGDFFDDSYGALQSQIYTLDLTTVASRPVKIAKVADDMNGRSLMESVLRNIPKQISRVVNCDFFSTMLVSALNAGITATGNEAQVTYGLDEGIITKAAEDTSAGSYAAFSAAYANLGEGDLDNGYDVFEASNSVIYARPKWLQLVRNTVGIFAGNTIAQEMVSSGSFTAFDSTYVPQAIRGYMGELNGVLVFQLGNLLEQTEGWLGKEKLDDGTQAAVAAGSLKHVQAILVCGDAVCGAMDLASEVKVIDAYGGQGYEVQPYARCGFATFSPKGVQVITDSTGITPSDFKEATSAASVITWTKKLSKYAPLNR